ncbi:MAG: TIGR03936 family radical SAM-associated protein [Chloroflexota bacterium]
MRIRVTFSKTGALRYIGHLDLHKLWERSLRRADMALMYSLGFHPQPKIQLASALPLGFSSRCEIVDLWIDGEVNLTELPSRLTKSVPPGLGIMHVIEVDEKSPPMQTQINTSEYLVTLFFDADIEKLQKTISFSLSKASMARERRGKAYDLRPLIDSIEIGTPDADGWTTLIMILAAREGATGRPEEVLDELGIPYEDTRVERRQFTFK